MTAPERGALCLLVVAARWELVEARAAARWGAVGPLLPVERRVWEAGAAAPSLAAAGSAAAVISGRAAKSAAEGSPASPPCSDADILCFDFESDPVGEKPSGDPWEPSACSDQTYQASVTAGSGVNASQGYVTGNASSGTNYCALMTDLGTLSEFWVRGLDQDRRRGPEQRA